MIDIDKVVDFVWKNYSELHSARVKNDYKLLFTQYPHGLEVASNGDQIKAVAYYYKLNRKQFDRLKQNKLDITDIQTVKRLRQSEGRNIHFILLVGKDAFRHIYKHLKIIIEREKAKTVSWYRSDMEQLQLFTIRRK